MNQSSLIDAVRTERARLDALLAGASEAQMTHPGVQDEWSVKDMVAHLTFWEQGMVDNLKRALRSEEFQFPSGELDDINAQVFAENQHRSLDDILADSRQVSQELLEQLQAFSDEDLLEPVRLDGDESMPLWQYIAMESSEHYQEHMGDIIVWRDQIDAGRSASQ